MSAHPVSFHREVWGSEVQNLLNRFFFLLIFTTVVNHSSKRLTEQERGGYNETLINMPEPPSTFPHGWKTDLRTCVVVKVWIGSETVFFFPGDIDLTPADPRWVGAWWLGFLVASCLIFIAASPYFFFPRSMPKEVGINKLRENVPKWWQYQPDCTQSAGTINVKLQSLYLDQISGSNLISQSSKQEAFTGRSFIEVKLYLSLNHGSLVYVWLLLPLLLLPLLIKYLDFFFTFLRIWHRLRNASRLTCFKQGD